MADREPVEVEVELGQRVQVANLGREVVQVPEGQVQQARALGLVKQVAQGERAALARLRHRQSSLEIPG
jgi:hypothetical protein